MDRRSVERVIEALNRAEVRYLVAGGLAVVAHGHLRLTVDVDIILDLKDPALRTGLRALGALGYRPRAPVPLEQFADATARAMWLRDKNVRVFSLYSDEHPTTDVDLFVDEPLDFDAAYRGAVRREVAPGVEATFVGLDELLSLKRAAGRPKDLEDIRELECLRAEGDDE